MILNNVDLHGIAEAREIPGQDGLRLQRAPESVRVRLNPNAQRQILSPGGAEIRFVMEDGEADITLSCPEGTSQASVFFGPFFNRKQLMIGAEPQTIKVATPERLKNFPQRIEKDFAYSPRVCRIVLSQGSTFFHGVKGKVRPPAPEETPRLRMLSYGTSITHGAAATAFHLTYVSQTAWRLGADLRNLGVGGACHCEPELADYMAGLDDWDFATLCLSVNMIGAGFSIEEFCRRTSYLIGRLAKSDPKRIVACISILPYFGDWGLAQPNAKARPSEFRTALGDVIDQLGASNVVLFAGPDLLTDPSGLATDLIHPGDHGMIEIGENLADRLRPLVKPLRN